MNGLNTKLGPLNAKNMRIEKTRLMKHCQLSIVGVGVLFIFGLLGLSGCKNTILSSEPAQGSWHTESQIKGAVYALDFVTENDGWAVARKDDTSLLRTSKPKPEDSGWIIYQTHDGGKTFDALDKKKNHNIRYVNFVDQNNGWALDEDNSILKTTDGGKTWQLERKAGTIDLKNTRDQKTAAQKEKDPFQGIVTVNGDVAFAYGGGFHKEGYEEEGILLGTSNGGKTWEKLAFVFQQKIQAIYFTDPQHGWVYDAGGSIYRTMDGGRTWAVMVSGNGAAPLLGIFFLNNNNEGWVVGKSGDIRHSTDGGKSWQKQTSPASVALHTVFFNDKDNGWAAGDNGVVLGTQDGGAHWYKQDSDTGDAIAQIQFKDPKTGWAASQNGVILKYQPPQ